MFKSSSDWDNEWIIDFDHYQQDKRHAFYINAILDNSVKSILEIAAGSFRDTHTLNELKRACTGLDFSEVSIQKTKALYPELTEKVVFGDAFNLPFENNSFDASFHNGFWGYFSNKQIDILIKEQARVSKKIIIATVHNRHNEQFFGYFEKSKNTNALFDIRFFTKDEMIDIMAPYCKNVKIIPVGKQKKFYEDDLINLGLTDAFFIKKSFDYHKEDLIQCSERLMCVGYLE